MPHPNPLQPGRVTESQTLTYPNAHRQRSTARRLSKTPLHPSLAEEGEAPQTKNGEETLSDFSVHIKIMEWKSNIEGNRV